MVFTSCRVTQHDVLINVLPRPFPHILTLVKISRSILVPDASNLIEQDHRFIKSSID